MSRGPYRADLKLGWSWAVPRCQRSTANWRAAIYVVGNQWVPGFTMADSLVRSDSCSPRLTVLADPHAGVHLCGQGYMWLSGGFEPDAQTRFLQRFRRVQGGQLCQWGRQRRKTCQRSRLDNCPPFIETLTGPEPAEARGGAFCSLQSCIVQVVTRSGLYHQSASSWLPLSRCVQ